MSCAWGSNCLLGCMELLWLPMLAVVELCGPLYPYLETGPLSSA